MQHLPFTCTSAFEALGRHELCESLKKQEQLEVQLFNACIPPFFDVVKSFNDSARGPQCQCFRCAETGLIHEYWKGSLDSVCTLWPAWDRLLVEQRVSVDPGLSDLLSGDMWHGDRGDFPVTVDDYSFPDLVSRAPPLVSRLGGTDQMLLPSEHTSQLSSVMCSQLYAAEFFTSHHDMRASTAAVVQWHGRWCHGLLILAAWGQPVTCMRVDRIAQWLRLWQAVASLHNHNTITH